MAESMRGMRLGAQSLERDDVAPAALAIEPLGCSGEGAKACGHDAEELCLSLRPALRALRRQAEFACECLHVGVYAALACIARTSESHLRPLVCQPVASIRGLPAEIMLPTT